MDFAGWQAKMASIEFGYHDVMRTSPIATKVVLKKKRYLYCLPTHLLLFFSSLVSTKELSTSLFQYSTVAVCRRTAGLEFHPKIRTSPGWKNELSTFFKTFPVKTTSSEHLSRFPGSGVRRMHKPIPPGRFLLQESQGRPFMPPPEFSCLT